jgi:phage terminase Nu1 subunit (DNA packaging protein)
LGLTSARIRQLQRDGTIKRVGRGAEAYDLAAAVRAYCDFMRDSVKRQGSTDELKAEKVRQAKAAAEKLEIANAKSRGELVPVAEVSAAWANLLRDVRAGMLAVPARCGAELATKLAAEDVAIIDRGIRHALEALADDR